MDVDAKLKVALDESRLLILGAQVLFGFQFEAAFQEQFSSLSTESKFVHGVGVCLLLLSVALLIAPSMHHRLVYGGEGRKGALEAATNYAGASLLPLTLGLGGSTFVVFDHLFGRATGIALAMTLTITGLGLLYGLGFALRATRNERTSAVEERATPLKTKIEQMLTEARVLIPGAQALLGFQFIATLTRSFQDLPAIMQQIHVGALCAVALAAMLLMTPAAVHRIAYDGDDDESFFRIGSRFVIAGALPLAVGIAADVAVVFYKISESFAVSIGAGTTSLGLLLVVWFVYPALLRHAQPADAAVARQRAAG